MGKPNLGGVGMDMMPDGRMWMMSQTTPTQETCPRIVFFATAPTLKRAIPFA